MTRTVVFPELAQVNRLVCPTSIEPGDAERPLTVGRCPTCTVKLIVVGAGGEAGVQLAAPVGPLPDRGWISVLLSERL